MEAQCRLLAVVEAGIVFEHERITEKFFVTILDLQVRMHHADEYVGRT